MTLNRRQVLQIATNEYTAQVDAELSHFQQLANKQLLLAEALEVAICNEINMKF